ncbi:MAG: hypothetical protein QGH74_01745, partial [Candidatus Brocadiia bacterium]|nr:hypothetical protein [Candidatus Brocadiia bacterium]
MSRDDNVGQALADAFEHLAADIDLARHKSVKPKHLFVDMRRAAIQAGRLALEAAEAEAILNFPDMSKNLVGFASLLKPSVAESDDSALGFWKMGVLPWLKAKAPNNMKPHAGAFDFPPPKTDTEGNLLGKDGRPARVRYFDRDGQEIDRATWEAAAPGDRGRVEREVASVVDDYDEADSLAHLRTQAGDYADGCRVRCFRQQLLDYRCKAGNEYLTPPSHPDRKRQETQEFRHRREDVPERQFPAHQTRLHGRCSRLPPELQRHVRPDEVVV